MEQLEFPDQSKIYLDTSPIIYSVEKHEEYWSVLASIWKELSTGQIFAITSELTLLETLVQPWRLKNKTLIAAYEDILNSSEIELIPINKSIIRRSVRLRADLGLRTPDAIHAATALETGCQYFLTNDKGFARLSGLSVVVLSDLMKSSD